MQAEPGTGSRGLFHVKQGQRPMARGQRDGSRGHGPGTTAHGSRLKAQGPWTTGQVFEKPDNEVLTKLVSTHLLINRARVKYNKKPRTMPGPMVKLSRGPIGSRLPHARAWPEPLQLHPIDPR
jgi:hypothetical protein